MPGQYRRRGAAIERRGDVENALPGERMTSEQLVKFDRDIYGLGCWQAPQGPIRRLLRRSVHYLSHKFILNCRSTRTVQVAGFRLAVWATVFDPKLFLTSEFFAKFIGTLDLSGKRVADVGTGSGILALAAARAGSRDVLAIDINSNAVKATAHNSRVNGFSERVTPVCSNLMSSLAPRPLFDVIISNPPLFPGEPRDVADRAWLAGPHYRDIAPLFEQARQRLKPTGLMYVLLSSDSDLHFLGHLIAKAGFRARLVTALSIVIESLIIYELAPQLEPEMKSGDPAEAVVPSAPDTRRFP